MAVFLHAAADPVLMIVMMSIDGEVLGGIGTE